MELKVKRLSPQAILPTRGSVASAGLDLYACIEEEIVLRPGEIKKVPHGLAIALPEGTAGFLFARSGLGSKGITLPNGVGVVDSDYRGEVSTFLINLSGEDFTVHPGDRVSQLVVLPVVFANVVEASALSDTERGTGGFGSTGMK